MTDPKRPWQGAETRLGLKVFGRDTAHRQQTEAGLGWALLRMRPSTIDEGEIKVPPTGTPDRIDLTGAEYRTLREDCGLSISEAAVFHDVRQRSIEKWEQTAPPGGAADEMVSLRSRIEAAAAAATEVYLDALSKRPEIEGVDIYRYEAWSYPESVPAEEGLPHGAHNRLISKTADLLAATGVSVKIEYWAADTAKGQSPEPDLPDFIARSPEN